MSSLNATAVDNNDDNHLQNNNVYVYKGGRLAGIHHENIEHVRIDESVSIIDDGAFYVCRPIQTVSFSTSHMLKKIGEDSFYECNNLLSIDLQNTQIESIGESAFRFCFELMTIQFPATIRKIGNGCFEGCRELKAIDLSHVNHLESIEKSTFSGCSALSTINLPPSTSSIGYGSFELCTALETVDLRITQIQSIGEKAFNSCRNLTNICLPTTTKCIGRQSFCGCKQLASLDLQATSVERIGDYAFWGCRTLQTINFPKTLKYIGKQSFHNCTNLKYLNLHETSIEEVGNRAFSRCTNLTTVVGISTSRQEQLQESTDDYGSMTLPASLVDIGKEAFDECPTLKNSIDNNWIHYQCDVHRGGRRFLQRGDRHHHENNNDGDAKRHGKVYYSSLWPLILYRVMNEMELPSHSICPNDDDLALYTKANPVQRRASVVFYLLIHGVIADLQSQAQSRNVQATESQAAASTSSSSSLTKKRKAER